MHAHVATRASESINQGTVILFIWFSLNLNLLGNLIEFKINFWHLKLTFFLFFRLQKDQLWATSMGQSQSTSVHHCSPLQLWLSNTSWQPLKKAKCFNALNLFLRSFFRVLKSQIIENQICFKTFKSDLSDIFWIAYFFQSTLFRRHSIVTANLIIFTKLYFPVVTTVSPLVLLDYSQTRK